MFKLGNKNLGKAKNAKNDEFYTQISDIEKELVHYKDHFRDKVIFCNCDDPEESNFWKYFMLNFQHLGLKKLISTHYHEEESTYKLEYDGENIVRTELEQNGDFRSPEAIEILEESQIICTNPPFSKFIDYINQLVEYDKKFLIIGNANAITYKDVFPLLRENKVWLGYSPRGMDFLLPNGDLKNVNACWFTNLEHSKRHEEIILYKKYTPEEYPKYDNYDAINIDKVKDIPNEYYKPMGVPITFMDKYNPEQFEIVGLDRYTAPKKVLVGGRLAIDGKPKYARILIKRKQQKN